MFVSFRFKFRSFFHTDNLKVERNSDFRYKRVTIQGSLLQNMNSCEKQKHYHVTITSRTNKYIIIDSPDINHIYRLGMTVMIPYIL